MTFYPYYQFSVFILFCIWIQELKEIPTLFPPKITYFMLPVYYWIYPVMGFPCGSAGKESARNVGDLCSIPGLGRYPGEGKGYPLHYSCCRKGDPFQGLKLGSWLILRNELSEETQVLTKQEILLGKGTWVESSRIREPRRTALPHGLQCRVLWSQDQFPGCLQPIILTQSTSWWCPPCSAKMDTREKDSGRWSDMWCLLLTFPELFRLMVAYSFCVPYQNLLS